MVVLNCALSVSIQKHLISLMPDCGISGPTILMERLAM